MNAEGVRSFCDAWDGATVNGDDDAALKLLREAPAGLREIADEALPLVEDEEATGDEPPVRRLFGWIEERCHGSDVRHVAIPLGDEPAGLRLCRALGGLGSYDGLPAGDRGMVLYGSAVDPYAGPMLGVIWNPAEEGDHSGDGEGQAVRVRGVDGAVVPLTVFQQAVVPELGTVVAWEEDGRALGLYGRLWPQGRGEELVRLAERLTYLDGRYVLPPDALPAGHREVYSGDGTELGIVVSSGAEYQVQYQRDGGDGEDGLVSLSGSRMSEDGFLAFQFLTRPLQRRDVAGRDAIVGNAWHDDGPALVTWREEDGLVVRMIGLGAPLEEVLDAAAATRDLTPKEWGELVSSDTACDLGP